MPLIYSSTCHFCHRDPTDTQYSSEHSYGSMVARGVSQDQVGPGSSSGSGHSSPASTSHSSNVNTTVVIPVCITILLVLFACAFALLVWKVCPRTRRTAAARTVLPIVSAAEKPQLYEVLLETRDVCTPAAATWGDFKPLSVKYISRNIYDVERAIAASALLHGGSPAETPLPSRPVSAQAAFSWSTSPSGWGWEKASVRQQDGGRLRVVVAIAMPSPTTSNGIEQGKSTERTQTAVPPPLYIGVADIPWKEKALNEP